jgi:Domain of unknown function (DUF3391).
MSSPGSSRTITSSRSSSPGGIDEVYIDIEKGLDVGGRKRTKPKAGPGARSAATQPIHTTRPEVPLKEELQSAREITRDAVRVVDEANRQVMKGKVPDVRQTYELANRMNDSLHRNRDALLLLSRIRSKDEYTLRHSVSVSSLVLNLCNYRQVSEYQTLDLAVGPCSTTSARPAFRSPSSTNRPA